MAFAFFLKGLYILLIQVNTAQTLFHAAVCLRLKFETEVPGFYMVDSWHAPSSSDIVQTA